MELRADMVHISHYLSTIYYYYILLSIYYILLLYTIYYLLLFQTTHLVLVQTCAQDVPFGTLKGVISRGLHLAILTILA